MEERFSYSFLFPLQEITLRRLIVDLWTAPDVLSAIENFSEVGEFCLLNSDKWQDTIESKVADKLSKLVLPKSLAKKLFLYITPIGLEIKKWKEFHEGVFRMDKEEHFDASILDKLCWTPAGTVDYRKTAEEIIRFKLLHEVQLYCLACTYCLEDYIPALWKQLPTYRKMMFCDKDDHLEIKNVRLKCCWPYILKREQSLLDDIIIDSFESQSFNVHAFISSAYRGNKAATEYFWQKMTPEEKETSLLKAARELEDRRFENVFSGSDFPPEKQSEVFCYLISLMNQTQQSQFFRNFRPSILNWFFDWPWQDLFSKIEGLCRNFQRIFRIPRFLQEIYPDPSQPRIILNAHYHYLLNLFQNFVKEYKYYFPMLFQEIFIQSPMDSKNFFIERECQVGNFLSRLFSNEDSESVEVIFKNIDLPLRIKLVSCEKVFELFHDCICRNKWHMVEVCLREATLSKKDGESLRRAFLGFLRRTNRGHVTFRKEHLKRFHQLLNQVNPSSRSKRRFEDKTGNGGKKFCSNK